MDKDQLTHTALVLEVEKHECLYNKTLPDYSRKDVTEDAWLEISNKLQIPVPECKDKWRNIRSTFRRTFKPSRKGKTKRSYYLSRYLNFILPHTRPIEDSIFHETKEGDNDYVVVLKDVGSKDSMNKEIEIPTSSQRRTSSEDMEELRVDDLETKVKFNSQVDVDTNSSLQTTSSEEDFSIPDHLKMNKETKDDVDQNDREHMKYFFLSLLPEFRNMSEKQRWAFKIKVLQLIDDIKNKRLPDASA